MRQQNQQHKQVKEQRFDRIERKASKHRRAVLREKAEHQLEAEMYGVRVRTWG